MLIQRTIFFFLFVCLILGSATYAISSDAGPVEMKLTSSIEKSKKPPAVFPHKKHQDSMTCGECHHGMQDGKQVAFIQGQEIKKCETCHNKDVLGGKTRGKNKLDTFKGAAHENCLNCHKKTAKSDPEKKSLKSCKNCHQK